MIKKLYPIEKQALIFLLQEMEINYLLKNHYIKSRLEFTTSNTTNYSKLISYINQAIISLDFPVIYYHYSNMINHNNECISVIKANSQNIKNYPEAYQFLKYISQYEDFGLFILSCFEMDQDINIIKSMLNEYIDVIKSLLNPYGIIELTSNENYDHIYKWIIDD